jgi:hypothetical protein
MAWWEGPLLIGWMLLVAMLFSDAGDIIFGDERI